MQYASVSASATHYAYCEINAGVKLINSKEHFSPIPIHLPSKCKAVNHATEQTSAVSITDTRHIIATYLQQKMLSKFLHLKESLQNRPIHYYLETRVAIKRSWCQGIIWDARCCYNILQISVLTTFPKYYGFQRVKYGFEMVRFKVNFCWFWDRCKCNGR